MNKQISIILILLFTLVLAISLGAKDISPEVSSYSGKSANFLKCETYSYKLEKLTPIDAKYAKYTKYKQLQYHFCIAALDEVS